MTRVLFRPRWHRQWVHGYILARKGDKFLLQYGVNTDFGGHYTTTQWRHRRHIVGAPV